MRPFFLIATLIPATTIALLICNDKTMRPGILRFSAPPMKRGPFESVLVCSSEAVRSDRRRVILGGVLSREAILRAASGGKARGKHSAGNIAARKASLEFLSGAVNEAIYRQRKILLALERQGSESQFQSTSSEGVHTTQNDAVIRRRDEVKCTLERLMLRRKIVNDLMEMRTTEPSRERNGKKSEVENDLVKMGFKSILETTDTSTWSSYRDQQKESGRPKGFGGLVFMSPRGIPILVGRTGAHADETLRRVSQGSDLWFQVTDYAGSRVLLRTSLQRGLKGSKKCIQMAANIAAYYSQSRFESNVDVMYTDSKHVAKRGSKVGRMRLKKSLGTMVGYPHEVADITEGREP
mmetsp:Transcript_33682/g.68770  ORF Transcript_33682/g.68770 Transcript_33682/m.68770 type:complete len:352 (-) Transcript_33682:189-1244(-)